MTFETQGRASFDLRAVIEALPAAVYTTDAEGRITHFNAAAVDLSGRVPELGTDRWCVTWKLYRLDGTPLPHDRCPMAVALAGGRAVRGEEIIVERPDGQRRRCAAYPTPLFDGDGRVVGGVNMLVDVSDRTEHETLRTRLAAIVDSSDDAIISKGLDGLINSWNQSAERLFGYTADEMIGQPVLKLIPPDRRHEEATILGRLARGERIEHFDTVRVRKDGASVHVSLTISPIRDASARVVGASKTARDITERTRAEIALRESERRYRRLMELLPVGVYMCEAPSGAITFYNQHAVTIWGRAPKTHDTDDRFCGALRLFQPDGTVLAHDRTPMAAALRTGEPCRDREVVVERPDGSRVELMVNVDPLYDEDGGIVGAVNVFHDVTLLKRAAEELRTADRRKNEFLAILAHELRNPLAPLSNGLEILRRPGTDGERRNAAMAIMGRQLVQMSRLIDDLLDISRISRGKIEVRLQSTSVATVVQQAVEAVRPGVERYGHELQVSIPDRTVYVSADPTRLAQGLGNLLQNACKFTPRGGRIRLDVEVQSGRVALRVRDNGVGIPRDKLGDIFELFAQHTTVPDESQSGLGIGLTLAKNLIELQGGTLEASSGGEGQGSEFVITLPLLAAAVGAQPAPEAGDAAGTRAIGSKRVLVVDDNRDSAESLAMLLALNGYEVRTAADGSEALAIVPAFAPHAILLDIGLPLMDGYEVARRIRRSSSGGEATLVAVTGWGQPQDRARSREAGFDSHLVKPVDLTALLRLLEGDERPTDGRAATNQGAIRPQ